MPLGGGIYLEHRTDSYDGQTSKVFPPQRAGQQQLFYLELPHFL